jgi:hypothetical protein
MHWIASNFQQAITGIYLSGCSLLFSIGTFHTNSFLFYPVDCTKVIRFSTQQYFHFIIVGFAWWASAAAARHNHRRRCRRRYFAATCVSRGPLLPPTTSASAALVCFRRRRRGQQRRRRSRTPAADSDVGGATLQPASTGFWAGQGYRMPSGAATFRAEH